VKAFIIIQVSLLFIGKHSTKQKKLKIENLENEVILEGSNRQQREKKSKLFLISMHSHKYRRLIEDLYFIPTEV
jgi:hypothetical protein